MKMQFFPKLICLFLLTISTILSAKNDDNKMYFATVTDTEHFRWTLNHIASIHHYNFEQLGEIQVFDIGLTKKEIKFLNSLDRVTVYPVEKTNPEIFKRYNVWPEPKKKMARGWYSWKPVAIKQALDRHESVLYIDSGWILTGPVDLIFQKIRKQGYFLVTAAGYCLKARMNASLAKKFGLYDPSKSWILEKETIAAGIQGLTRELYRSYVFPIYELSQDINNFKDDGTAPNGFGNHRHDQALFTMYAHALKLNVDKPNAIKFQVKGQEVVKTSGDFFKGIFGHYNQEEVDTYLRYKK